MHHPQMLSEILYHAKTLTVTSIIRYNICYTGVQKFIPHNTFQFITY